MAETTIQKEGWPLRMNATPNAMGRSEPRSDFHAFRRAAGPAISGPVRPTVRLATAGEEEHQPDEDPGPADYFLKEGHHRSDR
jgi:hypothetical protein